MPKVNIEFDMPAEEFDLKCALEGHKWRRVVRDLAERLRNLDKYGEDSPKVELARELRTELNEAMDGEDLSFE